MNIQLPKTQKGFTLIELLVVIAILAILAVIGVAAYRNLTTSGNDARRRADLKAAAGALEANRVATGYVALANNQFASGSVPVTPSLNPYCISSSTTAGATVGTNPTLAQLISTGACNSTAVAGVGGGGAGWSTLAAGTPAATTQAWMICTTLQDGTTVVCVNSAQ